MDRSTLERRPGPSSSSAPRADSVTPWRRISPVGAGRWWAPSGHREATCTPWRRATRAASPIEAVDIAQAEEIAVLRERLSGRRFDILFVNAGTANRTQGETIADVSTDEFVRVMVTNALGVMRAVEALQDLVPSDGLIGVMSSGQGSIGNNTRGGHEVYRGSKAALNQYHAQLCGAPFRRRRRAMLLMAPGWIRTELGGPDATFGVEETIPEIVDVLLAQRGRPGLRFLDRKGQTVPVVRVGETAASGGSVGRICSGSGGGRSIALILPPSAQAVGQKDVAQTAW